MKKHDRITIIRNRHRAGDLRRFRVLVETYFERSACDEDDLLVDWDGARAARAQVNRMLPRVIQIVEAAGLTATPAPGQSVGGAAVLHGIFRARDDDGTTQQVLDLIDMALGVYDAGRFNALARTVNPFHYLGVALGFVARLPGRMFAAVDFRPWRTRVTRPAVEDTARADASLLTSLEELIEMRFAQMREWQADQFAEHTDHVADLAERLDFAERMLAQPRPANRIEAPSAEEHIVTPA